MTQPITIKRLSDGREWKVPEECIDFLNEATQKSTHNSPNGNGTQTSLELYKGMWTVKYNFEINYSEKFLLDSKLYSVQLPNTRTESEIAEVLNAELKEIEESDESIEDPFDDKDYQAQGAYYMIRSIARSLRIPLNPETENTK